MTTFRINTGELGPIEISYSWPRTIDELLASQIIALIRATTRSTPIIGFGTEVSDTQAQAFIEELRAGLAGGKIHYLAVKTPAGQLVGQCILRRNLNPNNCHIADLGKGVVDERFRDGGAILAAAFLVIADVCDQQGIQLLTLDVRAGTRAHKIWERFGFKCYGFLDDYARSQGQSFAGYFMSQRVESLRKVAHRIAERASVQVEKERAA